MKWSLIQTYNFEHCYRRNDFDDINTGAERFIGLILERQNYIANSYFHICSYASYSIHI